MHARIDRQNDGQALMVAVVLAAALLSIVGGLLFQTAVSSTTQSSHSAEVAQAGQAAQSGIAVAYQQIHAQAHANTVPCGDGVVNGDLGSKPLSSYSVTISYFSTTTANTPLSCSSVATGSEPQSVELSSVGTSTRQSQTMFSEATVSVTAIKGQVFGDATFTGGTINLSGADTFDIAGRQMYVKGDATCDGSGTVNGTLTVLGSFTMSGGCKITGSVVSKGQITASNGTVGGSLTSTDATATPDVAVSGNPHLHTIFARTTVAHPSWWTVDSGSNIVQHDTSLTTPPVQTFPTLVWTPTGWSKDGYTTVTAGGTCAAAYAAIFAAHTATSKGEAVYTTCKIKMPASPSSDCPSWQKYYCTKIVLNRNLAVFSTAGFTIITPGHVVSGSSTTGYDLVLAVPSETKTGAPASCSSSSGNIDMTGDIGANVDALLYTPCSVSMSGAGKIAEGEVYVNGTFTPSAGMSFGAPFTVPGSTSSGSGNPVNEGSATIGIIEERVS